MILITGSSGYMGRAFVAEMRAQQIAFVEARRPSYESAKAFGERLDELKPDLVINCAAFIPTPSVDLCKEFPWETFRGNACVPDRIATACYERQIPLMHLSTACLFDEEREYRETDSPTRDVNGYCGVYILSKLIGEIVVKGHPQHYILRLRLPFDQYDHPRNYLSKLASFPKVFDHVNSLTHRGDFVKAALDLWRLKAPWGVYHMANPGHVSAMQTVTMMKKAGLIASEPEFVSNETTGCTLSTAKLTDAGVKIRSVHQALDDALTNWKPA